MAVDEFWRSVEAGLEMSKRISYGKETRVPKMKKSLSTSRSSSAFGLAESYRPTAPMVYAVIVDPCIVDNPDICSYQPHVYGNCNPPALVPLHMHGVSMEIECYLDTAFVTLTGTWRLHCVSSSSTCDCRIAIPMGRQQGSVLGIEVETPKRSYSTRFITPQNHLLQHLSSTNYGLLIKGNIYTFNISQVEGGSLIHVNVRWSQKLLYENNNNHFCLSVPFTFPPHVVPVVKGNPMKEKVLLNVNSGTDAHIVCNISSTHPLKETRRKAGELGFSYEADVKKWSTQDLYFSFSVCKDDVFAGVLLQSPSLQDYDQRDMFCFYLFPGRNKSIKSFKKEVVFLVDISTSMRDDPLEKSKDAVIGCLSELDQEDSFNIIAFNGDIQLFSSSLELATNEAITNATKWMNTLIADGGTNLLIPLKKAWDMVGKTGESIPLIFLITDGAVEDEKDICNIVKDRLMDGGLNCPRICTFGIGSYCNHYFLQMLAHMGRGCYDAAYDIDSISDHLPRMLNNALSPVLTNVKVDALQNLESTELYPFRIPDLFGSPLIVSGRYQGNFPDTVTARGFMADLSTRVIDVKVRKAKGIPLDMVCARREIDTLTTHAWLDKSTQLEEKIANMSLQMGVPCEYTRMILVQSDKIKPAAFDSEEKCENEKMIYLENIIGVGFGNLKATIGNIAPGIEDLEAISKGAGMMMSSCWGMFVDRCCCMCFIQFCSGMNDRCAITLTQLCTALACFECLNCCCQICDGCTDLC
ncbi:hypothetical protein QVD17_11173 [Tagetes erecta]|uniref:VWFA domain-containing protein n=1 Tax=Tagetes erecta TaxID=13708 RepID=A0AAD8P5G3_TARER|nr:hypothetical protein QVD17_11173 [Tagetes erecta]